MATSTSATTCGTSEQLGEIMSAKPFHLAWFGSFARGGFAGRWSGSDARSWASGEFHIELAQALERADVDEHGPRALELHVVGTGVLQGQAVVKCCEHEIELQEGGVLEHRERPFVRV